MAEAPIICHLVVNLCAQAYFRKEILLMRMLFDEQDVMDSVHVYIAAKANRGYVEGSGPHHVRDVEVIFDSGFSAEEVCTDPIIT